MTAVEETAIVLESGEELSVTVSIGAAGITVAADIEAGEHLLDAADAALCRAKENGRNRVEIAPRRRWR